MSDIDYITRCGEGQRDKSYDREGALRRVLTLRADDRILPYEPAEVLETDAPWWLSALVLLGVLASGALMVYGLAALFGLAGR